jgi:hypothetical protein
MRRPWPALGRSATGKKKSGMHISKLVSVNKIQEHIYIVLKQSKYNCIQRVHFSIFYLHHMYKFWSLELNLFSVLLKVMIICWRTFFTFNFTDLKALFICSLETPALKEQVDVFFWYWKVIHLVCLMTGPYSFPQQVLYIEWYSASSFNFQYPLISLKLSSSCICLLPSLLVTSVFLSMTCFRKLSVCKMAMLTASLL